MQPKYWAIIILATVAISASGIYYASQPAPDLGPVVVHHTKADEFKNWKTYTNERYSFGFKYPQEWETRDSADGIVTLSSIKPDPDFVSMLFALDGNANPGRLGMREFYNSHFKKIYSSRTINDEDVMISGVSIVKIRLTQRIFFKGIGDENMFFLARGSDVFQISYNSSLKYDKTYDQILSTFKFTSPSTDTTTWKTYLNKEYAFEFKYPTDWSSKYNSLYYAPAEIENPLPPDYVILSANIPTKDIIQVIGPTSLENAPATVQLAVAYNNQDLDSACNWNDISADSQFFANSSHVLFHGINAIWVNRQEEPYYCFVYHRHRFQILYDNSTTTYQILSTFHFVDLDNQLIKIARDYIASSSAVIYFNDSLITSQDPKLKQINFTADWFMAHSAGIQNNPAGKWPAPYEYLNDKYVVNWRFMPGCGPEPVNTKASPNWYDKNGNQCLGGYGVSVIIDKTFKPQRITISEYE